VRPHLRHHLPIPTALAAASITLAGCGSKPATRASVIARADAICATANRALANLPPASGASGTTIDFIRAAPVVSREAKALRALPHPVTDRATLDHFIAGESSLAAGYRRLAAVQRAGDDAAVQSGLAALGRIDPAPFARRYGLAQCGATAATVR
jgi:hypothetical protein